MAMSRKPHRIELSSGKGGKELNNFRFRYSNSDVSLKIYRNGFSASYLQNSRPQNMGFDQKKKEIIKKAFLLFLIETGSCKDSYDVTLAIDKKEKENLTFFFLERIKGCEISENEKRNLQYLVLNKTRSNYPPSIACYTNYALSGTEKTSDAFRFLYQSFNSFFSNYVFEGSSPKRLNEHEKLERIRKAFFSESQMWIPTRAENDVLCVKNDFSNPTSALREINRRIERKGYAKGPINDISAFVLLCYSYYLRCKYFHGELSLPIVSADGDAELNGLSICCKELSSFIQKNIHFLINQDYADLLSETKNQNANEAEG